MPARAVEATGGVAQDRPGDDADQGPQRELLGELQRWPRER